VLAKSIPSKAKHGVGDAKREEVRFLILSGLPHKEVVKRSKVSSGTVSVIRGELRAVCRFIVTPSRVFACRLRAAKMKVRVWTAIKTLKSLVGPAGFEPAT
jgi:hypothetical protein